MNSTKQTFMSRLAAYTNGSFSTGPGQLNSGVVLTRFELPVKDKIDVKPDGDGAFPVDFYTEGDKFYMDAVVFKGEAPFQFRVNLVKDGVPIPADLLDYGSFFGGMTHKNKRYFIFLTE